jgi:hypothetical protein
VRRLRPAVVAALAALVLAAPAAAGEDPLIDPIVAGRVFYPPEANVSDVLVAQLESALDRASSGGHEVKVVLVRSPSDLGARHRLFGRPAALAAYVAPFLESRFRGDLLVAMPVGLAVRTGDGRPAPDLSGVVPGADANGLVVAATDALPRLYGQSKDDGGGSGVTWILVTVAAAAAAAAGVLAVVLVRRRARLPS